MTSCLVRIFGSSDKMRSKKNTDRLIRVDRRQVYFISPINAFQRPFTIHYALMSETGRQVDH